MQPEGDVQELKTLSEDLRDRRDIDSRNMIHGYALQEPRMQQLCESDDIEHYLTTFERIAEVCRWPRGDWAIRLIQLLTGKAI